LNDAERGELVENDEGLHAWRLRTGLGVRRFVRANRAKLDAIFREVAEGRARVHDGAYGLGYMQGRR